MNKLKKNVDNYPNWLNRDRLTNEVKLVHFLFDDKPYVGRDGESVAAALIASGLKSFRKSRDDQPRGIYCGMGTCFECLVTIDGHSSQRACLASVKDGMTVTSQNYAPSICSTEDTVVERCDESDRFPESCELVVIGAGPGGLASAISAARAGVETIVLDERVLPGGQYFKQLAINSSSIQKKTLDGQAEEGRSLIDICRTLDVSIYSTTMVWSVVKNKDSFEVKVVRNRKNYDIVAKQIIVATGAYEKPFPVPGWTLPGFMTTGAVQTLIRAYRVKPGSKVLICGNGPLNLQVASELVKEGVTVVAVVEIARPHRWCNLSALLKSFIRSPALMLKGLVYIAKLRFARVPMLYDHVLVDAQGSDCVESARVVAINPNGETIRGTEKKFDVDTVCVGYGFTPNTEITKLLRCSHDYKREIDSLVVARQANGATSCPGVFSVGDSGEVLGSQFALAQGTLAGASVARNLKKGNDDPREIKLAKRNTTSHLEFQHALWTLFSSPKTENHLFSRGDVIICRCEDITSFKVMNAIKAGATDVASVKKMTRVGMGRCQGRYCGSSVVKLLEYHEKKIPDQFSWFAPQSPVKPLPVGSIAQVKTEWSAETEGFETARLAEKSSFFSANSSLAESEIAIIGAGILGTCTADALASSGKDVILIDRGEPNGEASGNNAGSLHVQLLAYDFSMDSATQLTPACQVLPLQKESTKLWCELEKKLNQDLGIKISGGLMVAENTDQIRRLESKTAMERSLGIDVDLISRTDLMDRAPYLSEKMIGGAWCPEEGKINPMYATPAVLNTCFSHGVRLFKQTNVLEIIKNHDCFEIKTSKGNIKTGQIVNAAGGWSALIAKMVGIALPARPHPIQMIVTEPVAHFADQLLAYADRHLTLKQVANGNFIIGGGWRASLDSETKRPVVLKESLEGNLWVAKQVIPKLNEIQVIRSWAAMNVSVDGAPILGESKQVPGFYNLVSVNGVTLGPLLGQMTAESVLTKKQVPGISPFTLDRF